MSSHNEGEIWGAAHLSGSTVITSGDDNQVIEWDLGARVAKSCNKVTDESRKAPRGGASSLSDYPDSKCARAVAAAGDHVVIGCNDGTVRFRACGDLATDLGTA